MVKKFVLLGSPVAHSFSPAIQNAAIEAAGLDWRYETMEVAPEELAPAIASMRSHGWLGANVTIPHKEAVLPLLDEIDASAAQTSAVNTIVNKEGHLVGHNTDLRGFIHDLHAHWRVPKTGRSFILGAGGAARAVAFGLAQEGLDLSLIARTASHAERLAEDLRRYHELEVAALPWVRESFARAASQCALLVNATPLGMMPEDHNSPWPDDVALPPAAFVYDLVYSPREPRLVQQAQHSGLKAVSGAGMLLEQAALSYELWTGLRAPRERMRAALEEAMERFRPGGRKDARPDHREVIDA
ncbi:MAG: shikimate dehydrogenase [Anaerolineales bacterium]